MASFDDSRFDPDAVAAGAWAPSRYGSDDQLGTYNEVTAEKRASALAMLDLARPVETFSLGDGIWPGYPAYADRQFSQTLVVAGYQPAAGFGGEIVRPDAMGPSKLSYSEERVSYTFNMSTKINGFSHAGVDGVFYNGHKGSDIGQTDGVTVFDVPTWGPPLLTRGLMLDVAALVAETTGDVEMTRAGLPRLTDRHRITVDELEAAHTAEQELPAIEPGDALLFRTGWISLTREDPERFLKGSPGPFIAENKWVASHRPALVATDSWMWGVYDFELTEGWMSSGHQLMLAKEGIRLGESVSCEEVAAAGVDRFVFCHSPFRARGSTSCSSPPMAIGNAAP